MNELKQMALSRLRSLRDSEQQEYLYFPRRTPAIQIKVSVRVDPRLAQVFEMADKLQARLESEVRAFVSTGQAPARRRSYQQRS